MVLKEEAGADEENSHVLTKRSIAGQTALSNRDIIIRKGVFSYTTKKSTSRMLIEAVRALSDDRRGASVPAIAKWISGNYAVSDMDKLKLQVKKSVLRALKTGAIVRSETSQGSLGSGGSFVLGRETKGKNLRNRTE